MSRQVSRGSAGDYQADDQAGVAHLSSRVSGILMLKLKLQFFGHSMRRAHTLEKTLMLGKIEGRRRRGCQRTR